MIVMIIIITLIKIIIITVLMMIISEIVLIVLLLVSADLDPVDRVFLPILHLQRKIPVNKDLTKEHAEMTPTADQSFN